MATNVSTEKCSLCGEPALLIGAVSGREMYHCGACDLISVPPQWHLDGPAQQHRYLQHQNTLENTEYVRRFEALIEAWERQPGVGTSQEMPRRCVLDFGCGPSPVLVELLRRRGCDAHGYDPYFAPETELAGLYDAVFSVETFEHFCAPGLDVGKVTECVKVGAHLIVATQFHPGPEAMADWWYARDPTHVCFYSRRTMEWIGRRSRLALVECDGKSMCIFRRNA